MNRRAFVIGPGAVLAAPLGAVAQPSGKRPPTLGILAIGTCLSSGALPRGLASR